MSVAATVAFFFQSALFQKEKPTTPHDPAASCRAVWADKTHEGSSSSAKRRKEKPRPDGAQATQSTKRGKDCLV